MNDEPLLEAPEPKAPRRRPAPELGNMPRARNGTSDGLRFGAKNRFAGDSSQAGSGFGSRAAAFQRSQTQESLGGTIKPSGATVTAQSLGTLILAEKLQSKLQGTTKLLQIVSTWFEIRTMK